MRSFSVLENDCSMNLHFAYAFSNCMEITYLCPQAAISNQECCFKAFTEQVNFHKHVLLNAQTHLENLVEPASVLCRCHLAIVQGDCHACHRHSDAQQHAPNEKHPAYVTTIFSNTLQATEEAWQMQSVYRSCWFNPLDKCSTSTDVRFASLCN